MLLFDKEPHEERTGKLMNPFTLNCRQGKKRSRRTFGEMAVNGVVVILAGGGVFVMNTLLLGEKGLLIPLIPIHLALIGLATGFCVDFLKNHHSLLRKSLMIFIMVFGTCSLSVILSVTSGSTLVFWSGWFLLLAVGLTGKISSGLLCPYLSGKRGVCSRIGKIQSVETER